MHQKQLTPSQKAFLKKAAQMADTRITDSGFDVMEFSRMMGLSHSQLFRRFKAATGRSVSVFIRDRRLKYAAQLLNEGELLIAQISVKSGFHSESYFRKCFKEAYGVTPGEYARGGKMNTNMTRVVYADGILDG